MRVRKIAFRKPKQASKQGAMQRDTTGLRLANYYKAVIARQVRKPRPGEIKSRVQETLKTKTYAEIKEMLRTQ